MNKRWLTNTLLLLLIALVGFTLYTNNKKSKVSETPKDTIPVETEKKFDWYAVSKSEFETAVSKNKDATFDSTVGLKVSEVIDLTGDGVSEGIVVGDGGNNDTYFILERDSQGEISVLKEQELDGSITLASLTSVSRVKNLAGFKLLPKENGYYSVSQSFDEEKGKWVCGGVYAYKWNSESSLFVLDANLSAKYEIEGCKAPN